MKIKTYNEYLNESQLSSIKAGEDSKVTVNDQKTVDGKVISAQEILGHIISAETEDEFKSYFYDKYGSTKFDTATMGQMVASYNEYYEEIAAKEKEDEDDDSEGEEDALGDLDI
jgi:hypothetical protein